MRADKFFAEQFGSRTKAKDALLAGRIRAGERVLSPDDEITPETVWTILEGEDFVSNGGRKLERGLSVFRADVAGKVFADLGASTGGFTDCLLRRGAKRVYCVDVGESLLSDRLRADGRVVVMDRTNARYLGPDDFPERLDAVVSDLSFISLRLVLPAVRAMLPPGGDAFVLFKPQFECGGKGLPKSGILPVVRHETLLDGFYDFCVSVSLAPLAIVNAPILPKKNVEYIIWLQKDAIPMPKELFLRDAKRFPENFS